MKPQRNNRKPNSNQRTQKTSAEFAESFGNPKKIRKVILSGLIVWEKYASARKSATINATGGFIIDAQTSIMKTQMQVREIWKDGQKNISLANCICQHHQKLLGTAICRRMQFCQTPNQKNFLKML